MELNQNGVIVLQEPGKPDQQCKIIRTFKTADGKVAYEIQDVKTGEKATLTDSGSPVPEPPAAATNPNVSAPLKQKDIAAPVLKPVPSASPSPLFPKNAPATKAAESKSSSGILGWFRKAFGKKDQQTMLRVVGPDGQAMMVPMQGEETIMVAGMAEENLATRSMPTAAASEPGLRQLQVILRDSLYPSQREMAVEMLATMDWHADPNVVPVLLRTAQDDCAPTVRAASVRSLAQMHANTAPVMDTLQKLKFDPESKVRAEAAAALQSLVISH
jgi:hypothetical protein